jgi:phenylalanyl-tRNA synthetase beta chain
VSFGDVKSAAEAVAAVVSRERDLVWRPIRGRTEYHPRDSAVIVLDGEEIGYAGQLHPDVCARFDIEDAVYVFEIDSRRMASYASPRRTAPAVPRYPVSRRDVSLLVPDELLAGDVMEAVLTQGEPLVDEVRVFDEYVGEGVPSGWKALTFALVYRSDERTLTDEEVADVHDRVVAALCKGLGVRPRI